MGKDAETRNLKAFNHDCMETGLSTVSEWSCMVFLFYIYFHIFYTFSENFFHGMRKISS